MEEVKHHFHGLAQIHLPHRVVWGITLAEDVLFNEVLLHPLSQMLISHIMRVTYLGNGNSADEKVQNKVPESHQIS